MPSSVFQPCLSSHRTIRRREHDLPIPLEGQGSPGPQKGARPLDMRLRPTYERTNNGACSCGWGGTPYNGGKDRLVVTRARPVEAAPESPAWRSWLRLGHGSLARGVRLVQASSHDSAGMSNLGGGEPRLIDAVHVGASYCDSMLRVIRSDT